jgi:hypothetical protein
MKKVAISQSNYIPWKGYFDIIAYVDEFILYDCVQYTRRDWRNRNKIYTNQGLTWLTIPVETKGNFNQKINETLVFDRTWGERHWRKIEEAYSKAPYFKDYRGVFSDYYLNNEEIYLSKINLNLIKIINEIFDIKTQISLSTDYEKLDKCKTERLLSLCQSAGGDVYVSGPSAQNYFNLEVANKYKLIVEWFDYKNYKEYAQMHAPFEHGVTVLDLIFNLGPESRKYLKY